MIMININICNIVNPLVIANSLLFAHNDDSKQKTANVIPHIWNKENLNLLFISLNKKSKTKISIVTPSKMILIYWLASRTVKQNSKKTVNSHMIFSNILFTFNCIIFDSAFKCQFDKLLNTTVYIITSIFHLITVETTICFVFIK